MGLHVGPTPSAGSAHGGAAVLSPSPVAGAIARPLWWGCCRVLKTSGVWIGMETASGLAPRQDLQSLQRGSR